MKISGFSHVYGDNIDTDRIIPGKYTKTLDLNDLANHVLEDLDPEFRNNVQKGDIIVGGYNFGCGSSREQAPLAIKAAGVSAVVAKSFARIFFRNAINVGLPVIEVPNLQIKSQSKIEIDLINGYVMDLNDDRNYKGTTMPDIMIKILKEGGLVQYLRKYDQY